MEDKYLLIYETEPFQSDSYRDKDRHYLGFPTIKEAAEYIAKYEIEKQQMMLVGFVGIYSIEKKSDYKEILQKERDKEKAIQQAYLDANTKLCRISTLQIQFNKERKSLDDNLKDLKRDALKSRKERLTMLENKLEEVKLEVMELYKQTNSDYRSRLTNTHRQTEAREHLWDIQDRIVKEEVRQRFGSDDE